MIYRIYGADSVPHIRRYVTNFKNIKQPLDNVLSFWGFKYLSVHESDMKLAEPVYINRREPTPEVWPDWTRHHNDEVWQDHLGRIAYITDNHLLSDIVNGRAKLGEDT